MLYAQGLLGGEQVLTEDACSMPVSAQIDRLQRELEARIGSGFEVYELELEQLSGAGRERAFDAVVAGEPSPFVLVGDEMACMGSVDVDAVMAAIAAAR